MKLKLLHSAPACGRRCVLSLRAEPCGNRAENEKSEDAEESKRKASGSERVTDKLRNAREKETQAESGQSRTRATVMSRPSTAQAHTQEGQSDADLITPGTAGTSSLLRTKHGPYCPSLIALDL